MHQSAVCGEDLQAGFPPPRQEPAVLLVENTFNRLHFVFAFVCGIPVLTWMNEKK